MVRQAIPLSKIREKFKKEPKPDNVAVGGQIAMNAGLAIRYGKEVDELINEMVTDTEKELAKLYTSEESQEYFIEEPTANDGSIADDSRKLTNKLMRKWEKIFKTRAPEIATEMLNGVNKTGSLAIEQSLREISKQITIKPNLTGDVKEIYKASVNANVGLITSIQEQYFKQIVGAVDRSIMTGGGLQDLIPAIQDTLSDQKRIAKNRAKNIALDQTRKAYNSMNKAKFESVGVQKFEWIHSGGGREPRPLHKNSYPNGLNGGIFSFNDLPIIDEKTGERGIPGQAINCKCTMRPIIEFDD